MQTIFTFVLFSAVISVPFFFSGVAVCISLTRSPFAMGRVYFTDLAGASLGCLGSVLLLSLIDAPSAIFVIAAVLFVSAAAYGAYAGEAMIRRRSLYGAAAMLVFGIANASTVHGIQPIWSIGGLILSAGAGSLASDRWQVKASWQSRVPALAAAFSVVAYSLAVVPVMHAFTADLLWQRVLICLALVFPSGFLLGFCFPVGMRWLNALSPSSSRWT
jgi:hypothetical protein